LKIPAERITILHVNHDVLNGRPEMKRRALTLLDVIVVIVLLIIFLAFVLPNTNTGHTRDDAKKAMCAANLRQITLSLNEYSQENQEVFPMLDLRGKVVGEDMTENNLKPGDIENSFADIPKNTDLSVSQNLWLLVRHKSIIPKVFICPGSKEASEEWNLDDQKGKIGGTGAQYFVDFPHENSAATISYSFVQPWSLLAEGKKAVEFFWSSSAKYDVIIAADANNGSEPNYNEKPSQRNFEKYMNTLNHKQKGQNIVHIDGSVNFSKSPYTGISYDNIYTAQAKDYKGEAGQTPGVLSVRPKDQFDTVLIPNREEDLKNWDRVP
jgi:type II secretory pathway pseudopilin PulG